MILTQGFVPVMIFDSSNAKVTPLFEKALTKSDAGRIGRLVLPKKNAEVSICGSSFMFTSQCSLIMLLSMIIGLFICVLFVVYSCFPPISNPEGEHIVIQDMEGKDWDFNYRLWCNNSRMYVLEGVYPYIQSKKLEASDINKQTNISCDRSYTSMWIRIDSFYTSTSIRSITSNTCSLTYVTGLQFL